MKNLSIIVTLTFFYLISGCESPTESFVDALQYYPLKIGNKWYYRFNQTDTSDYNYVVEIVGDTIINSKLYFKRLSYFVPQNQYSYISYYHVEKSKLFIGWLSYYNGEPTFSENLTADFSLGVGDTLRINEYKYITVTEKDEDIVKFYTHDGYSNDFSTFRKGVGLIENLHILEVFQRIVLVKYELI